MSEEVEQARYKTRDHLDSGPMIIQTPQDNTKVLSTASMPTMVDIATSESKLASNTQNVGAVFTHSPTRVSQIRNKFETVNSSPMKTSSVGLKKRRQTAPCAPTKWRTSWPDNEQVTKSILTERVSKPSSTIGVANKEANSPLKERIGLFESLSQTGVSSGNLIRSNTWAGLIQKPMNSAEQSSNKKKSIGLKRLVRRISASWASAAAETRRRRRSRKSASGDGSSETNDKSKLSSSQEDQCYNFGYRGDRSPDPDLRAPGTPVHPSRSMNAEVTEEIMPLHGSSSPPSLHETIMDTRKLEGYSKLRETQFTAGLLAHSSDESTADHRAFVKGEACSAMKSEKHHSAQKITRSLKGRRRWISKSNNSVRTARVSCELEQPRPVRANEVRRLVSLCRNHVNKLGKAPI